MKDFLILTWAVTIIMGLPALIFLVSGASDLAQGFAAAGLAIVVFGAFAAGGDL